MAPRFSSSCTSTAALTRSPCRLPGGGAELRPPAPTLLLEGAVLVSAVAGAEACLPPAGPLGLGKQVPVVKKLPTAATREPSTPDMPRMWRSLCWRPARISPSRASVPSSCSRCLASSSAVCTPVCSDSYSSSTPLHQSEVSIQSPPIRGQYPSVCTNHSPPRTPRQGALLYLPPLLLQRCHVAVLHVGL